MEPPTHAPDMTSPRDAHRDGPLLPLLVVLTSVTGLVDAISYLQLGHVFVANMTGNVVFLGFAIAGAPDFSMVASLVAIAAFLVGAVAGGRLGAIIGQHRSRFLAIAILAKLGLVGVAWIVAVATSDATFLQYGLITLLALAMGLQNAAARFLAVPDLTTTVLTLTLTGLAADSTFAGGNNPRLARRLIATGAMFAGATLGAVLVLYVGLGAALALTFTFLCGNAIAAYRVWSNSVA